MKIKGFTLIELLVVIAIIGILAGIVVVNVISAKNKARDTRRIIELTQMGKLIIKSCYVPAAGPGEYDLGSLVAELRNAYPQYAKEITQIPHDPKSGTETVTNYHYIVNDQGNCALFANLEQEGQQVTLPAITSPTPGGGKGIFQSTTKGWNGTDKFFQVSNQPGS